MAYTTIDNPELYFQVKAFSGTGSSNAVTYDGSENMQADLLWFKNRQQALNWMMFDSVRGITKYFYSNLTEAEGTSSSILTAIGSDGFTVGANNNVNQSSNNIINYGWKAGTSFTNDASATGIGSIDSSGSVNETAGFSIVSYTGSGSAATVKHGLSTTPNMMIIKNRVTASKDWQVYSPVNDPTDALALNQTDATGDSNVYWNDTAPTSSVFSVHSGATNTSGAATIGYIFSERQGYSKFGRYIGNANADGPFIYTGFKPAMVILKLSSVAGENWYIFDNKRDTDNVMTQILYPNLGNAEATGTTNIDFLSNGFKLRNAGDFLNGSGRTNIYACFAENPFVNSNGVPCNAR